MKLNIFIITVFAVLLGNSCKKNEQTQNPFQSYLRFKLDNVQTECNIHIKATYIPPTIGPDAIITISGDWTGGSIALKINEGSQVLTTGTYTFLLGKIRSGEIWLTPPPASGGYYSGLQGGVFNPLVPGSGQIVITEISPDYVKGIFECVLTNTTQTNIKVITGGEFHIKRG